MTTSIINADHTVPGQPDRMDAPLGLDNQDCLQPLTAASGPSPAFATALSMNKEAFATHATLPRQRQVGMLNLVSGSTIRKIKAADEEAWVDKFVSGLLRASSAQPILGPLAKHTGTIRQGQKIEKPLQTQPVPSSETVLHNAESPSIDAKNHNFTPHEQTTKRGPEVYHEPIEEHRRSVEWKNIVERHEPTREKDDLQEAQRRFVIENRQRRTAWMKTKSKQRSRPKLPVPAATSISNRSVRVSPVSPCSPHQRRYDDVAPGCDVQHSAKAVRPAQPCNDGTNGSLSFQTDIPPALITATSSETEMDSDTDMLTPCPMPSKMLKEYNQNITDAIHTHLHVLHEAASNVPRWVKMNSSPIARQKQLHRWFGLYTTWENEKAFTEEDRMRWRRDLVQLTRHHNDHVAGYVKKVGRKHKCSVNERVMKKRKAWFEEIPYHVATRALPGIVGKECHFEGTHLLSSSITP